MAVQKNDVPRPYIETLRRTWEFLWNDHTDLSYCLASSQSFVSQWLSLARPTRWRTCRLDRFNKARRVPKRLSAFAILAAHAYYISHCSHTELRIKPMRDLRMKVWFIGVEMQKWRGGGIEFAFFWRTFSPLKNSPSPLRRTRSCTHDVHRFERSARAS